MKIIIISKWKLRIDDVVMMKSGVPFLIHIWVIQVDDDYTFFSSS